MQKNFVAFYGGDGFTTLLSGEEKQEFNTISEKTETKAEEKAKTEAEAEKDKEDEDFDFFKTKRKRENSNSKTQDNFFLLGFRKREKDRYYFAY